MVRSSQIPRRIHLPRRDDSARDRAGKRQGTPEKSNSDNAGVERREWIRQQIFLFETFWLRPGLYMSRHGLRNWLAERRANEWVIDSLNLLFKGGYPVALAWWWQPLQSPSEYAGSLV